MVLQHSDGLDLNQGTEKQGLDKLNIIRLAERNEVISDDCKQRTDQCVHARVPRRVNTNQLVLIVVVKPQRPAGFSCC